MNIVPHFEAALHQAWKHQDEAKSVLGVYVNDSSADLFLLVHGELVNVVQEALTPMDLLIYSFIPILAALMAKGPLLGEEEEHPTAEQIPVGTAIPLEVEEPYEEDELQES